MISPIPTKDRIQIKGINQELTFELFDLNGRKLNVSSERLNTEYSLNISHVEKGIYLLKIKNKNNSIITRKIVKE